MTESTGTPTANTPAELTDMRVVALTESLKASPFGSDALIAKAVAEYRAVANAQLTTKAHGGDTADYLRQVWIDSGDSNALKYVATCEKIATAQAAADSLLANGVEGIRETALSELAAKSMGAKAAVKSAAATWADTAKFLQSIKVTVPDVPVSKGHRETGNGGEREQGGWRPELAMVVVDGVSIPVEGKGFSGLKSALGYNGSTTQLSKLVASLMGLEDVANADRVVPASDGVEFTVTVNDKVHTVGLVGPSAVSA